jgi:hypothetical protein
MPAAPDAKGAAPAPPATAPIAGLQEWNERRAETRRLIADLKANPARAKAAQRFEQEWLALDRAVQNVGTLQARGRLDAKAARVSADALQAQLRRLQSAARALETTPPAPKAKPSNEAQKESQVFQAMMSAISEVIKNMSGALQTAARAG